MRIGLFMAARERGDAVMPARPQPRRSLALIGALLLVLVPACGSPQQPRGRSGPREHAAARTALTIYRDSLRSKPPPLPPGGAKERREGYGYEFDDHPLGSPDCEPFTACDVAEALAAAAHAFDPCWNLGPAEPGPIGALTLRLAVSGFGAVVETEVVSSTTGRADLDQCIARGARQLSFAFVGGNKAEVTDVVTVPLAVTKAPADLLPGYD